MFKNTPSSQTRKSRLSARQQRIYDFLVGYPVGVLSSVSEDAGPHGAVVYFVVDEDFSISFITKSGTRKHRNLLRDGPVAFTVFEPTSQTVVQINGLVDEITDMEQVTSVASRVFRASRKFNRAGMLPINKLEAGHFVAFRLRPSDVRMAVYESKSRGSYTQLFDSVESFDLHTYG